MNIRQIIIEIHQQLAGQYPGTEIESFARILFGHYLGMAPAQVHLSQDNELPAGIEEQILSAVDGLKQYRPIQYILGETEFYGLKFEVTSDVLIPRPETEELVDWIVHEYNKAAGLDIVDVGTGSGCIAIALAANLPNAKVWAVDVSETALAVAQRNAKAFLHLSTREREIRASQGNWVVGSLNFLLDDVLKNGTMGFEPGSLDVIVSNPPYIAPSEKQQMLPNVLEYEPHVALFTPEDDPLIFYKRIAAFGTKCLKDGGRIFFEINEAFCREVADVLKQSGYSDVTPRKDINGKWRMISARLRLPA